MRIALHSNAGRQSQSDTPRRLRRRLRGNNGPLVAWVIAAALGATSLALIFAYGGDAKSEAQTDAFYGEIVHAANKIRMNFDGDYSRLGDQTSSETRIATIGLVPSKYIVAGSAVTPWNSRFQAYGLSLTNFAIVIRDTSVTPSVTTPACASIVSRLASVPGVVSFTGSASLTLSPTAASTGSHNLCMEPLVMVTMS